jgi:hypothetical protein
LQPQQRLSLLEQLLDRRFSSVETVVRGMRGELETGMRKVRADARESLEGLQDVAASIRRLESALDRISRAVGLQEGASMAPKEDAASSGAKPCQPVTITDHKHENSMDFGLSNIALTVAGNGQADEVNRRADSLV